MRKKNFIINPFRVDGDTSYITLAWKTGEFVLDALIDTEDLYKVVSFARWRPVWNRYTRSYYVVGSRGGVSYYLHRFLMDPPDDQVVDHTNHVTHDNRKGNLKVCSYSENQRNKRAPHSF